VCLSSLYLNPWYISYLISLRTLIDNNHSENVATNALSILERLTTFPTQQTELNSFWVTELAINPKPKQTSKKGLTDADLSDEEVDGQDENDDWRKFFDAEQVSPDVDNTKGTGLRLHKMTIHQSLHSLASHRAVFTRAWLTLLPRLSGQSDNFKALTTRALNIMHRGVLPHLTRPLLVMDWIGECVDLGQFH
jgi:U3 small nucleolar RNA-associated protein 19